MSAKLIAALQERAKLKSFPSIPTPVDNTSPGDTKFNQLDLCICNRQLQDILCRSCGYIFVGRHRRQCSFHPNEIHLMDSVVCPKCRTDSLIEIKTSKTPVKHDSDEIVTELAHLRQRRCSKDDKGTRRNSIGTGTENEDWGNEFNKSFSPSMNMNIGLSGQKEVSNPSMIHAHSDDAQVLTSKNVRSQLNFDDLKSPQSKVFGTANNMNRTATIGSKLMYSDVSGSHSDVYSDKVLFSVQAKSPDYKEMPRLEQISSPANNRIPMSVQPPMPISSRMPLSQQQTTQIPQHNVDQPKHNLVDTEVQTEFVPQFYYPTAQAPIQPIMRNISIARGYNYEPRKAVGGEKENNILRAAIRRGNTEGWNKGLDRSKDMCMGDRRF